MAYSQIGMGPVEMIHQALARDYMNRPECEYEVHQVARYGDGFVVMFRRSYTSDIGGYHEAVEHRVAIFGNDGKKKSDMII